MSAIHSDDLAAVVQLHDEEGALSCYLTVDPDQEAAGGHPWETKLFDGLDAVASVLGDHGDPVRSSRFAELIVALRPLLRELTGGATPGRGRALFAGLGSG